MKPKSLFLSLAIAALVPLTSVQAQKYVPAPTEASLREADFLEDFLEDNDGALAILRVGIERGTDAQLKANAEHMLADHRVIDSTLGSYLARRNVDIMGKIDAQQKKQIPNKTGHDWDGKWADELADKHKKMITRLEAAEGYVEDEELRGIIAMTLPTLRAHYEMSESMKMQMKKRK